MKTSPSHFVVLITAPGLDAARALAQAILGARLAACVNLVPRLESHYWWEGKIQCGKEVLLLCKTRRGCLRGLERLVLQEHPYDTPEVVALALSRGTARYLEWITRSCQPGVEPRP